MISLDLGTNEELSKEFKIFEDGKEVPLKRIQLNRRVTIIVGANNSRKSRFLRHILTTDSYLFCSKNHYSIYGRFEEIMDKVPNYAGEVFIRIKNLKANLKTKPFKENPDTFKEVIEFISRFEGAEFNIKRSSFKSIMDKINKLFSNPDVSLIEEIKSEVELLNAAFKVVLKVPELTESRIPITQFMTIHIKEKKISRPSYIEDYVIELASFVEELVSLEYLIESPNKTYIPTLRGTVQLIENIDSDGGIKESLLNTNIFADTIAKYYNFKSNVKIFTGQNLYKEIKSIRNSIRTIRERFDEFENFISFYFFENKTIDIIPLEDEPGQIQIYIENDSDRKIHQLGDGIQSLLILLFPIFNADSGDWIFIEEPEINLHPGLQSLFLNTITKSPEIVEKNLNIFISSHSNHLLNCVIDQEKLVNILSFEQIITKDENYSLIRNVTNSKTKTLELIGVKNSSTFMSNCSIWVEGISDRYIIKAFLNVYCKSQGIAEFIEGYHYTFFEYAGSNLVHYLFSEDVSASEIEKIKAHLITNKIFLLADTDTEKEKKHKELESLTRDDFIYNQTGAIEIENIISSKILLLLFKSIWEIDSSRFRIADKDYESVRLGEFFNKRLNPKLKKVRNFKGDSGTLTTYYKNKISEFILKASENGTITWDDVQVNEHAKRITENLYTYIRSKNN